MGKSWWHQQQFRLFLDYHTPDHADQTPPGSTPSLQQFDPEAIAEAAGSIGVESLIFYARDNQGNLHYPSSLGHYLSDLGGRDLVQEWIDVLKPRGIRAIACFQPIRDRRTFETVPAWRQINNDGSERIEQGFLQLGKGGHRLVCPLGGAGETVLEQLRELVSTYDLDGIWWDRVGDIRGTVERYPCFCESCQSRFYNETGLRIPKEAIWNSPVWRTFWSWRARALLDFQTRAHRIVQECGRDTCLIGNYAFYGMVLADPMPISVDMEAMADATDVASLECQHFRSYLLMSVNPRYMRALTDNPCEMLAWRAGTIGDGVVRSRPASEATICSFIAHGHTANFQDNVDHEGRVDPRTISMLEAVIKRFQNVKLLSEGARPLRYAAVLFSPSTFTWYGGGNPDLYAKDFIGTVRHFLRLHIPFDIISDRHITPGQLEGFQLLALPKAACLSDSACDAIEGWVENGGVLLASHDTSRFTEQGYPRDDFRLGKLLGISYVGATDDAPLWMRARPGILADLGWEEYPVALRGGATKVSCHDGTEVLADLGNPMPGFDIFAHFINPVREWGPYPAVTRRSHGNGHAFYLSGNLGAADLQWGTTELHTPYRVGLTLAASPPVEITAPASVELVVRETDDGSWLVYLINLQGEVGRTHRMPTLAPIPQGISEILPVHDIDIVVNRKHASAREILDGQDLEIEQEGDRYKVTLPRLDVTACVVFESGT
jgi:hypothetical protein